MKEIIEAIKEKRCILFAGAGVSRNAGLPDWLDLGQQLCDKLREMQLISKEQLSYIEPLAKQRETIPIAVDAIYSSVTRQKMCEVLNNILQPRRKSSTHEILKKINLKGYLTTNYDHLLEAIIAPDAFRLSNSLPDLKQMSFIATKLDRQFILKLHGDMNHMLPPDDDLVIKGGPFMVLAKSDYTAFQMNRTEQLRLSLFAILQMHSVLFVGYSFADPDITSILNYLTQYSIFSNPSWYVTLADERVPILPTGVKAIQPFRDWSELPNWLNNIWKEIDKAPLPGPPKPSPPKIFSKQEKSALNILGEFITGLESEDLSERVLGIIIMEEIEHKDQIEQEAIVEFVGKFLNVGESWAKTFAKCALRHMVRLGIIKENEAPGVFKISRPILNRLQEKARFDWKGDRDQFYDSVRARLREADVRFDNNLKQGLDDVLQNLCMHYGRRMAEWIQWGIGEEIAPEYIEQIVNIYFSSEKDRRIVKEVIRLIMNNPFNSEVNYLYKLISASFLLNSIKLDPVASKFVKEAMQQYEIYLDANIILPLIVCEHENNHWIRQIIETSREAVGTLLIIDDIWEEVIGHRQLAGRIIASYQDNLKMLSQYELIYGPRSNCFVKGYLKALRSNKILWRDYISQYRDNKMEEILHRVGIKKVEVSTREFDETVYKGILNSIKREWDKRLTSTERNPRLNEHEAIQFLQIYKRRKELVDEGRSGDVWFLSTETVFEKVYLQAPEKWGKPPTFPLSAWAGFLDSRLIFEQKNRKDVLSAILKGCSSAYGIPDSGEIVRRKAFGDKVLSEIEATALSVALSDEMLIKKLDRTRNDLLKKPISKDSSYRVEEFEETSGLAVGEVKADLEEEIKSLRRKLSESRELSAKEVRSLEQEIIKLRATIERLSGSKTKGRK